jgi:endonuclease YncB( thermonuclease family)
LFPGGDVTISQGIVDNAPCLFFLDSQGCVFLLSVKGHPIMPRSLKSSSKVKHDVAFHDFRFLRLRRNPTPGWIATACVVVLGLLRFSIHSPVTGPSRAVLETATVGMVIDGDTVELTDGRRLRLQGIDAPEIGGPDKAAQPWSAESAAWLRGRILSRPVHLELTGRDRYGRLLAWIYDEEGGLVNMQSLSLGMSRLLDEFGLPWDLEASLRQAEAEARLQRLGVWRKEQKNRT